MFVPKELVQNALMALPLVRRYATRCHHTGIENDAAQAAALVTLLEQHLDVRDASILEIGPGQTDLPLQLLKERGARRVVAVDIEEYRSAWPIGVEFRLYDGSRLPFADGEFDTIFSNDVLEHVRHPARILAEATRVLRRGGRMFHRVDVRIHYHEAGKHSADDLRYSDLLWKAMTWNRSAFTNRLRYSEWLRLFESNPLKVLDVKASRVEALRKVHAERSWLRHRDLDDVMITSFEIVLERV